METLGHPRPDVSNRLATWLVERGVDLLITYGIGKRAMALLDEKEIAFVVGAEKGSPETLIADHLNGSLQIGKNFCEDCFNVKIKLPNNI